MFYRWINYEKFYTLYKSSAVFAVLIYVNYNIIVVNRRSSVLDYDVD